MQAMTAKDSKAKAKYEKQNKARTEARRLAMASPGEPVPTETRGGRPPLPSYLEPHNQTEDFSLTLSEKMRFRAICEEMRLKKSAVFRRMLAFVEARKTDFLRE